MTTFSAQVDDWVKQSEQRMTAVFRESTQRTVNLMQAPVAQGGNMPVDTGFLRNSLTGGVNSPRIGPGVNPGTPVTYDVNDIILTIAGAKLGDTIFLTYSANYAGFVEFGSQGRPPRRFVGLAVQRWQETVTQVTNELKARIRS